MIDHHLLMAQREVDAMLPGTPAIAPAPERPKDRLPLDVVRRILSSYARCSTCNRKPARLEIEPEPGRRVRVLAICHGPEFGKNINYEWRDISVDDLREALEGYGEMPDMTFFRKRVYSHRRPTLRELLEARR